MTTKILPLLIFFCFAVSCNNANQNNNKLDLINGNLNDIPIVDIVKYIKLEEGNYHYIDKSDILKLEAQLSKILEIDSLEKNGFYEQGVSIGYYENDKTKTYGLSRLYINLIESESLKEFNGEISAGISKNTSINEIRGLFGKETSAHRTTHIASSDEDTETVYLLYYNNIVSNIIVVFTFNTNLKHKYDRTNKTRYFYDINGKSVTISDIGNHTTLLKSIYFKSNK